jgi:DNA-binding SARP family transcriptional activator
VRYRILGPLQLEHGDGNSLYISARKVEILLAVLLVRSGKLVTIDEISTEIWGRELPRRATAALYVYVSQLRKVLAQGGGSSTIVTRAPGYLLRRGSDELDLDLFQSRVAQGRDLAATQRHNEAAGMFESALDMWAGPPLGDLRDGPILTGYAASLDEARLECTELMIESNLALGRHRQFVGRLYDLTAAYPFREAFHRQLMLALYRSERQADALRVYQSARESLKAELGVEPGRRLQDLQQAVLSGDVRLYLRRTG